MKVEYARDHFVKLFIEPNIVEGNIRNFSFKTLVEEIKSHCGSLSHLSVTTIRIRFRDEDGDFVNLDPKDSENFKEMLQHAASLEDRMYKKIYLRVSELDSLVVQFEEQKTKPKEEIRICRCKN